MDNCPQCGASYALVGRVHNCRPKLSAPALIGHVQTPTGSVAEAARESATYKYRDPAKRRFQVAKAMRDYRARKKNGAHKENRNVQGQV